MSAGWQECQHSTPCLGECGSVLVAAHNWAPVVARCVEWGTVVRRTSSSSHSVGQTSRIPMGLNPMYGGVWFWLNADEVQCDVYK